MQTSDFERLLKQGQKRTDADNAIVEKRLAQMYRDAYKQAAAELASLYARLGDKLDLPEARKYKRLDGVLASISAEYKKLTGKALTMAIDTSAQNYTEAFYSYQWAMNQATEIALAWSVLPVDAIRASVFSEYSGKPITKMFADNGKLQLADIHAAITRGLATGSSYAKTADSVKDAFKKGYWQSLRVVRTESGRNYTEGHLKAHDDAVSLGINTVKIWNANLDERTRDAHGILDGTEADKNGMFSDILGGNGPGPHLMRNATSDINCRCRITEQLKGLSPELRRIKGEGDPQPYIKFEDWASAKGWTREKGWPKVKLL
jgi:hypothetical protein